MKIVCFVIVPMTYECEKQVKCKRKKHVTQINSNKVSKKKKKKLCLSVNAL